jgi:hypothetical protein
MARAFTLTAVPELTAEGDHKGELDRVTFIATDGVETHRYWTTNTDRLEEDFAQTVTAIEARNIIQRLRRGETVSFPNMWSLDDLFCTRFDLVSEKLGVFETASISQSGFVAIQEPMKRDSDE